MRIHFYTTSKTDEEKRAISHELKTDELRARFQDARARYSQIICVIGVTSLVVDGVAANCLISGAAATGATSRRQLMVAAAAAAAATGDTRPSR